MNDYDVDQKALLYTLEIEKKKYVVWVVSGEKKFH